MPQKMSRPFENGRWTVSGEEPRCAGSRPHPQKSAIQPSPAPRLHTLSNVFMVCESQRAQHRGDVRRTLTFRLPFKATQSRPI